MSVFNLTHNKISNALINAVHRGIEVTVLSEHTNQHQPGSDIEMLRAGGASTYLIGHGSNRLMHHKYAIFDRNYVLSGSYNWTSNAARNDENLVLVNEAERVAQFIANFETMREAHGGKSR